MESNLKELCSTYTEKNEEQSKSISNFYNQCEHMQKKFTNQRQLLEDLRQLNDHIQRDMKGKTELMHKMQKQNQDLKIENAMLFRDLRRKHACITELHCRNIALSGRNKKMINDITVQNQQIELLTTGNRCLTSKRIRIVELMETEKHLKKLQNSLTRKDKFLVALRTQLQSTQIRLFNALHYQSVMFTESNKLDRSSTSHIINDLARLELDQSQINKITPSTSSRSTCGESTNRKYYNQEEISKLEISMDVSELVDHVAINVMPDKPRNVKQSSSNEDILCIIYKMKNDEAATSNSSFSNVEDNISEPDRANCDEIIADDLVIKYSGLNIGGSKCDILREIKNILTHPVDDEHND